MSKNNKIENEVQEVKPKKKRKVNPKLKHGVYATAITAALIAVIIVFNVVATILADKYPVQLDLTANKDYSVSEENEKYIKDVSRNVTITVCCDESDYTDGTYGSYLEYSSILDQSGGKFFTQSIKLLKDYAKLNDKITLQFLDPQDPSFTSVTSKYPNDSFAIGDMLVEANFDLNGQKVERNRHLKMDDLYTIDSTYAQTYGYYTLSESNVETAITSAIYSCISDKAYNVAVITANGGKDLDEIRDLLSPNNYEFTVIDDLIKSDIPDNTDIVIVSAPTMDYQSEELKKIDKYLDINGNLGKSFLYIASQNQKDLTNINEFLSEWGYTVSDGLVYETDENKIYLSNYDIFPDDGETDITKELSDIEYSYFCSNNIPIKAKYDSKNNYTVNSIIQFGDTTVAAPADADNDYDPSKASDKGPFVALAATQFSTYDNTQQKSLTSSVIVVSGTDFIQSGMTAYRSIANHEALLATIDTAVGREDEGISFVKRTIDSESYQSDITNASSNTVFAIFVIIVPLLVVVAGVFVIVRRKRL